MVHSQGLVRKSREIEGEDEMRTEVELINKVMSEKWQPWQLGSYAAYKVLRQWLITLITGSDEEWRRK